MAQPVTDWNDYNWFIQTYLPKQTIPTLRGFANIIYTRTKRWLGLKSTERKADLVFKIGEAFGEFKAQNQFDTYRTVRLECEMLGQPVAVYRYAPAPPAPTFGGVPQAGSYGGARYGANTSYSGYNAAAGGSAQNSSWHRSETTSNAYNRAAPTLSDWKASPMWKPVQAITDMELLPDIAATENSHVKKDKKMAFSLPLDVCQKLQATKANPAATPAYSLRLFCTSSDYFRAPNDKTNPANSHISNRSIPIEYPSAPDIRVDDLIIQFKERGLRGKAGSAPPFDLNKSTRGLVLQPGRMMSVTFGHQGPTVGKKKDQAKRFFFQIVLVEWTSKEGLQKRLADLPPTPAKTCLEIMRKMKEDDDDIEVGSSRMSLKDPLSYMRITRPVRSKKCTHQQCFDATWWIESNVAHPQWLCPLCNKELKFDELIVDGYFMSILEAVPDTVEEVTLEAGDEWHTEDGKYGSAGWLSSRASGSASDNPPPAENAPRTNGVANRGASASPPAREASALPDTKGKRKAIEILSSDDEEDTPLSRARTSANTPSLPNSLRPSVPPRQRSTSSRPSAAPNDAVIDLTLSDDEDEDDRGGGNGSRDAEADTSLPDFRHPDAGLMGRSAAAADSYPPRPPTAPQPKMSYSKGFHFYNEGAETRWRRGEPSVREQQAATTTTTADRYGTNSGEASRAFADYAATLPANGNGGYSEYGYLGPGSGRSGAGGPGRQRPAMGAYRETDLPYDDDQWDGWLGEEEGEDDYDRFESRYQPSPADLPDDAAFSALPELVVEELPDRPASTVRVAFAEERGLPPASEGRRVMAPASPRTALPELLVEELPDRPASTVSVSFAEARGLPPSSEDQGVIAPVPLRATSESLEREGADDTGRVSLEAGSMQSRPASAAFISIRELAALPRWRRPTYPRPTADVEASRTSSRSWNPYTRRQVYTEEQERQLASQDGVAVPEDRFFAPTPSPPVIDPGQDSSLPQRPAASPATPAQIRSDRSPVAGADAFDISSETDLDQSFYTPPSRPASQFDPDHFYTPPSRPVSRLVPSQEEAWETAEKDDGPDETEHRAIAIPTDRGVSSPRAPALFDHFDRTPPIPDSSFISASSGARNVADQALSKLRHPDSPTWSAPARPQGQLPPVCPGQLRRPTSMTWLNPLDGI